MNFRNIFVYHPIFISGICTIIAVMKRILMIAGLFFVVLCAGQQSRAADDKTNNVYCHKEEKSQSAPIPPDGFCPPPFFKPANVNACVHKQEVLKMMQWRAGAQGAVEFAVSAVFNKGTCRIGGVAQAGNSAGTWVYRGAIYPGTPSEKTCNLTLTRSAKGVITIKQGADKKNCLYICNGRDVSLDGLSFSPAMISKAASAKLAYKKPSYFNHDETCP